VSQPDPYLVRLFEETERIVAETLPKLDRLRRPPSHKRNPSKPAQPQKPKGGGRSAPTPTKPPLSQLQPLPSRPVAISPPSSPSLPLPPSRDWKGAALFLMSVLVVVLVLALTCRGL
jgi:hypothetical protein